MSQNQENKAVIDQLSFKDYYELKKQEITKFRDDITILLDISVKTFYRKLQNNSWSAAEKVLISQFVGIDRSILFPE